MLDRRFAKEDCGYSQCADLNSSSFAMLRKGLLTEYVNLELWCPIFEFGLGIDSVVVVGRSYCFDYELQS